MDSILSNADTPFSFLKHAFEDEFVPKITQDASVLDKEKRVIELKIRKEKFKYMHTGNVPGAPFLEDLPVDQKPSVGWFSKVVNSATKIAKNVGDQAVHEATQTLFREEKISDLWKALNSKTYDNRPKSLKEYEELFRSLPKPAAVGEVNLDVSFCRYRIAGPNPMRIEPCSNEQYSKFAWENVPTEKRAEIEQIKQENRLFIVDYSIMATLESGVNQKVPKYSMGPMALFEMPKDPAIRHRESIVPVCIQIEQKCPGASPPLVFFPCDGTAWIVAKTIVNSADGDFHEGIVHLGHTHLIAEAFLVATYRELSSSHPLFVLLDPHFEGTAFINDRANKSLIAPGGTVDQMVSQEITSLDAYIGVQVLELLKKDFTFPERMKRRKMTKEHFPAPYPYRDDGMLVWDAIHIWVKQYLGIYYKDSSMIKNDEELQNWINELKSDKGGRVGWLNQWNNSIEMLADVVASIIFTASAQHAAVNFPQTDYMSYAPALPLAMYNSAPKSKDLSNEDYLSYLPPMEMAQKQFLTNYLLGSVYYTTLGHYEKNQFKDARVHQPLQEFNFRLSKVSIEIHKRNEDRVHQWKSELPENVRKNWAYTFLLPERIPQSINI